MCPHAVDLVVVGVGSPLLPSVLEDCERKGVGALEIITSGFAETGPTRALERQRELHALGAADGHRRGRPELPGPDARADRHGRAADGVRAA